MKFICMLSVFLLGSYSSIANVSVADNPIQNVKQPNIVNQDAPIPEDISDDDKMFYKGSEFYVRGDYRAALPLFRAVSAGKYLPTSAFMAAILASGDPFISKKETYSLYEKFFRTDCESKDLIYAGALHFAKFADANGDWARIVDVFPEILRQKNIAQIGKRKLDIIEAYLLSARLHMALTSGSFPESLAEKISYFLRENVSDPSNNSFDMFLQSAKGDGDYSDEIIQHAHSDSEKKRVKDDEEYSKAVKKIFSNYDVFNGKTPDASRDSRAAVFDDKNDFSKWIEDFNDKKISFYTLYRISNSSDKKSAEAAEKALEKYIDGEAPSAWKAEYNIAKKYFKSGNYEKALLWSSASVSIAPPDMGAKWRVEMLYGDSLRLLGNAQKAKNAYLRITESRKCVGLPTAEALYKLGLISYDEGDFANAYRYFERVFIAYFNFEYWGSRAYYWAAMCQKKMGSNASAKSVLREYFRRITDRESPIYVDALSLMNELK